MMREEANHEERDQGDSEILHESSFSTDTRKATPDLAEDLASLIPNDLIADKTYKNCRIRSIIGWERVYLASIILKTYLVVGQEAYCPIPSIFYFIICPVLESVWVYIAKRNCLIMGAKRTTVSPLAAAIFLFIPAFNTLVLFSVFQELWRTSRDPRNWEELKPSTPIMIWWVVRIIILILVFVSIYDSHTTHDNEIIALLVIPMSVIGYLMEAFIIRGITQDQTRNITKYLKSSNHNEP